MEIGSELALVTLIVLAIAPLPSTTVNNYVDFLPTTFANYSSFLGNTLNGYAALPAETANGYASLPGTTFKNLFPGLH